MGQPDFIDQTLGSQQNPDQSVTVHLTNSQCCFGYKVSPLDHKSNSNIKPKQNRQRNLVHIVLHI